MGAALLTSAASIVGGAIGGALGANDTNSHDDLGLGMVAGSYFGAALVAAGLRDNSTGAFVGSLVGMLGGSIWLATTGGAASHVPFLGYGAVHGLLTVVFASGDPPEPDAPPLSPHP